MGAIDVRGLTKVYGDTVANDYLTFTVTEGKIFGYLGPNGAGKTTTIRTLMGLQSPTSGTAYVLGSDVREERELVDVKVPYLALCWSVGLFLSVLIGRTDVAERGGIAAIFMLFVVDAVSTGTDYEWLGDLSPTRYYDPTEILAESTYDVSGAVVLSVAAVALLVASQLVFGRSDL